MSEEVAKIELTPFEKETLHLLEKLNVIALNFISKSRSELKAESTGLDLSVSMLSLCQSFYRKKAMSGKELFVLEYIIRNAKRIPTRLTISQLLVNEEYIAQTYRDMMLKYSALAPNYRTPCSISDLMSLASRALRFGHARSYSPSNIVLTSGKSDEASRINDIILGRSSIKAENGFSVCERTDGIKVSQKHPNSCSVAIIYNTGDDGKLEEFFKDRKNLNGTSVAFACEPEMIFDKLIDKFSGIEINADDIPFLDVLPQLPFESRVTVNTSLAMFTDRLFGKTAVVLAAKKSKLKKIVKRAKQQGLSVCSAINPTRARALKIVSKKQEVLKFDLDFIRGLCNNFVCHAKIPHHDPMLCKFTGGVKRIFENNENAVYSIETDLSCAPYHQALYSATSLILSAALDGYDLTKGEMVLSVNAVLPMSSDEDIGQSVAAIAGLYRAESELCVSEENSCISVGDESKLTLSLRAYSNKRNKLEENDTLGSEILLATLEENYIPDFKKIREFIFGRAVPYKIHK